MPWVGGINTSVDPGVLNSQELVQADNVQFSSTGARIKREAFEHLDKDTAAPDTRASSGTVRTLKWTSSSLIGTTTPDQKLVIGEHITVTGNVNYNVVDTPVLSITATAEVSAITCVADTAGSLAGKYFLISGGDSGVDYYVWYFVSGSGADPNIVGRTGIQVNISTNAANTAVATATAAALNAGDWTASASGATVTTTAVLAGFTKDVGNGTSGFTTSVTTQGGHSITYDTGVNFSEGATAAAGVITARASAVIMVQDYWHFDGTENTQMLIYATDNFQLFQVDDSGNRVQILGQTQVTEVTVKAASAITTGHYFFLNTPDDGTQYYVWYNKASGGGNPLVAGRIGIEVAIGGTDANTVVATATAAAITAIAGTDFTAAAALAVVTITDKTQGIVDETVDVNTTFTFNTTKFGATAPGTKVETIRTNVFNERLQIYFSGAGNFPIIYNPETSPKYQLMGTNFDSIGLSMPDASFAFNYLGRVWANEKNTDNLHFSETFDETLWLGLGDSGVIPVFQGDGDPEGITNAYPYKGLVIVAKKDSRFRMIGDSPENFQIQRVSSGMGNEGSFAVAVDEMDVIFVSSRGIHSQQVTDQYGETNAAYLSADIKPTFNTFEQAKRRLWQGTYIPELNSIAIAVAEENQSSQNSVWLYNIEIQTPNKQKPGAWYRWPNVSCTALSRRFTNSIHKLVFGTKDGRIVQAQVPNRFSDFGTAGIPFTVKSGTIYPGDDPQTMKAFKRISMIYRPKGNFSFAVNAKIDNQLSQGFAFNEISGLDLLGETFILGVSLLGSSNALAPFTFTMLGYGRGVTLTITQPTAEEQLEIWGFTIEYEDVKLEQEVQ